MKNRQVWYWLFTGLLVLALAYGAVADLARTPYVVGVITQLGYPLCVLTIIGVWKALAVIALLVPGFPRLKEWAYAGVFFEMTGAVASHAMRGAGPGPAVSALVIAGIAMASWALRPRGRTHAVASPLKKAA
ncbi:MAG: DoxX family protein [Terracidiphilus sp.]